MRTRPWTRRVVLTLCNPDKPNLISQFLRDTSGSYLIIGALMMPVLVGAVGLGTDYGLWVHTHQTAQSATDSAAVSAATDGNAGNLQAQAFAVTASYGFMNGANGAKVIVNQPPKAGSNTTVANAVEVIVEQTRAPLFAGIFLKDSVKISARSVAIPTAGTGCVIALNATASGSITVQGGAKINLKNCNLYDNSSSSSALTIGGSGAVSALSVAVVGGISGASAITAPSGVKTNVSPTADPYADVSFPPFFGCDYNNKKLNSDATLTPGVYCGGLFVTAGAVATLEPGVYYMDGGDLTVAGNATLQGTGVTIVFTKKNRNNWATATLSSNAIVNLTAPKSGATAGIVMFGDRNMTQGTSFKLTGGVSQTFGGAIYLPKGALEYAGGSNASTGCTQIVTDTLNWSGNTSMSLDCSGHATKPIGSLTANLVE